MTRTLLTLAVALAIPWTARADAIDPSRPPRTYPAPTDCPRGTRGARGAGSHGMPPRCVPTTCERSSDCPGDSGPCEEIGVCQRWVSRGHSGPMLDYRGACATDDDCEESVGGQPARCEIARRCAGATTPPPVVAPDPEPDPAPDPEPDPDPEPEPEPEPEPDSDSESDPDPDASQPAPGCGCRVAASPPATPLLLTLPLLLVLYRRPR